MSAQPLSGKGSLSSGRRRRSQGSTASGMARSQLRKSTNFQPITATPTDAPDTNTEGTEIDPRSEPDVRPIDTVSIDTHLD